MLPKAGTSSRPFGAAATCCASHTSMKSASQPELSCEPVGSLLPRLNPAANGGVFIWGLNRQLPCPDGWIVRIWHQSSDSEVRMISRQLLMRTSESKGALATY